MKNDTHRLTEWMPSGWDEFGNANRQMSDEARGGGRMHFICVEKIVFSCESFLDADHQSLCRALNIAHTKPGHGRVSYPAAECCCMHGGLRSYFCAEPLHMHSPCEFMNVHSSIRPDIYFAVINNAIFSSCPRTRDVGHGR